MSDDERRNDDATGPGPLVDLIEYAAGIIVASKQQPYTAPYHWAGALYEAGMLVAPGSEASALLARAVAAETRADELEAALDDAIQSTSDLSRDLLIEGERADAAVAAVERVRALHRTVPRPQFCAQCGPGVGYPCPTVAALGAVTGE